MNKRKESLTHIGYVHPNSYARVLNLVGVPVLLAYAFSMLVAPVFIGKLSWSYLQEVWHSWQALNVGMLALLSSLIAFNITRHSAEMQRERNFVAARSFLPDALSILTGYCKDSARFLADAWEKRESMNEFERIALEVELPQLPDGYKETFSKCIASAEPDVAQYLSYILVRLQIHQARLKELFEAYRPGGNLIIIPADLVSKFYCLGELQALINRLYGFARGLEPFIGQFLEWEDFHNAYANLDIYPEEYNDLEGFTKRAISRRQTGNDI